MGWLQQVCLLGAMGCHSSIPRPPTSLPPTPRHSLPTQDSRQHLQTSQESMEHSSQAPSSGQWSLRARGRCVPGAALGPLCPQIAFPFAPTCSGFLSAIWFQDE